jgi:hypothetical protein
MRGNSPVDSPHIFRDYSKNPEFLQIIGDRLALGPRFFASVRFLPADADEVRDDTINTAFSGDSCWSYAGPDP